MIRNVYVSYAWKEESEVIVDKIVAALKNKNIIITRDKTSINYKGNIKQFMTDLGKSKHIVIIISDKYLRSINCMYELLTIYTSGRFEERIYPIVLSDAKIYDIADRIDYINYWEEKTRKVENHIKKLSLNSTLNLGDEYKIYMEISSKFGEISSIIESINTFASVFHEKSNFEKIADAIIVQNNKFETPETKAELKKIIQQGVIESNVEISLYEWLVNNIERLLNIVFNDFISRDDTYIRLILNTEKSHEEFKLSIKDHINWLIEMIRTLDPDVSIKEYVRDTELLYKIPSAYSDFFIVMQEILKHESDFYDLNKKESNILLSYVEFIIEKLE